MLTLNEINKYMEGLKDWDLDLNVLTKTFVFEDSGKVLDFLKKLMELSNALDHYPEIIINKTTVRLNLITHSENSLTKKDFDLAEAIDNKIILQA